METKLGHLSAAPVSRSPLESISNPIKPELFAGVRETQLGKAVGCTSSALTT